MASNLILVSALIFNMDLGSTNHIKNEIRRPVRQQHGIHRQCSSSHTYNMGCFLDYCNVFVCCTRPNGNATAISYRVAHSFVYDIIRLPEVQETKLISPLSSASLSCTTSL
jgi:hypothetical protein